MHPVCRGALENWGNISSKFQSRDTKFILAVSATVFAINIFVWHAVEIIHSQILNAIVHWSMVKIRDHRRNCVNDGGRLRHQFPESLLTNNDRKLLNHWEKTKVRKRATTIINNDVLSCRSFVFNWRAFILIALRFNARLHEACILSKCQLRLFLWDCKLK